MRGHCFCEQVEFEVEGDSLKLYQCHCSQCRRQSGSSSNTATLIQNSNFRWIQGEGYISSWTHLTGFRSDFCSICGSPVPNPINNFPYIWIPAGLLEDNGKLEIVAHLCVASKATWDTASLHGLTYEHLPNNLHDFVALLDSGTTS